MGVKRGGKEQLHIRFIERNVPLPMSVERVFEQVASSLTKLGHKCSFSKMPWGLGSVKVLLNLLFARFEPADIYHITGDVHYLGMRLPPDRTLLTIHDIGILKKRRGLRRYVIKKLYYDWPVRRLRHLTVISEATKREVVQLTNCNPAKIAVIENPLRETFTADSKRAFRPEPVILQVGTGENKNLTNVVRAVSGLSCSLRIVGSLSPEQTSLLRDHDVEHSTVQGLSETEMRDEYANADIVAFCSTYEGFGLPIIESQGMLTPVITSDLSPMKEVAGGGAALVDPYDPSAIRAAIIRIVEDHEYRESLIAAGQANVERFSAEAIARQYEAEYRKIIEEAIRG